MKRLSGFEIELLNNYYKKLKDNNLDLLYRVIEKYVKKEYVNIIFKDFFDDKEFDYIEDSFPLKNIYLKDKYKKYKFIFIDLKNIGKKSFIYFYKAD